jgi:signal transduction histidine kinase
MPVEISDILHVLAHELRTPVGIAHGYVRLLLEDRLPQEAERHRALEQLQKALSRLTTLSQESSALANWYERAGGEAGTVNARGLLDTIARADFDSPVTVDTSRVPAGAMISTDDRTVLEQALLSLVRSTARELRGRVCAVTSRDGEGHLDVLIGPEDQLAVLTRGPADSDAGPIAIDRGGIGLALVHATVVVGAHGGACWTMKGSRQTLGVRLPLADATADEANPKMRQEGL